MKEVWAAGAAGWGGAGQELTCRDQVADFPSVPGTSQILAPKCPCPGKALSAGQTQTGGHHRRKSVFWAEGYRIVANVKLVKLVLQVCAISLHVNYTLTFKILLLTCKSMYIIGENTWFFFFTGEVWEGGIGNESVLTLEEWVGFYHPFPGKSGGVLLTVASISLA